MSLVYYLPFGRDIPLFEDLTLHLQAPKEIKNKWPAMQGLEKTEIPAQEFFYFLSIYSWQMPSLGPSLSGKWEWKVTCQAGTSTCPGQQAYLYCRHCLHFPSIRTTLHREGIKLNTNWPKTFKEFVKLSNWWNVWLLGYTIRGEIGFQKLHDFHRAHTFFVKKNDRKSIQYIVVHWAQIP